MQAGDLLVRQLLCKEVLRIPFPPDQEAPSASLLALYMDIVRRARTIDQLLTGGVPYKDKLARISSTSVIADLITDLKAQWQAAVERIADQNYPTWRELFQKTGSRLPFDMRKELEPASVWEAQRPNFVKALLEWAHASNGTDVVAEITNRLDAVLDFTIFVSREFLLGNYSLEKHHSDVFDWFQLQYLAMDRFIIVSGDPDLSKRTQQSAQADRIMSFDQFLTTL